MQWKISKKKFEDNSTRRFVCRVQGRLFEGFVVRKGDRFYAYQNLCKHLPITLDLGDNDFFTHNKAYLQCHMHGAVYEIETGKCVGGPCIGANLNPLECEVEKNDLLITIPESPAPG